MYTPRSYALLSLLLAVGCRDKEPSESGETGLIDTSDTGDSAVDSAHTGETALDDEELPESTVTIEEDIVWDEDVSLGSMIYVPEGVTLTVMAGVNVSFQPGSGIVVDGTILLSGNEDAPVTFTNDYSLSNSNYGLSVGGTGDTSVLNYAAFTGIDVTLEGQATDLLHDSTFSDSTLSVLSRGALFTIEDCTFTDNARDGQTSINARELPELMVSGSTFTDGAYGVHFNGLADGATLTVTNSTFDAMSVAVIVGNQGEYGHIVTLSELDITNATADAIALYRSDADVSNVTITGSLADGLYTDALSNLVADEVTISGTDEACLYVLGSADLKRTSAADCGTYGIFLGEYGATITESSVADVDSVGIYSSAALTVSDTTVSNTPSHGIYAVDGALTVSDVSVTDAGGSGIYVERGNLVARDSTVSGIAGNGFYASYNSLVVSDVTVDGVRGQGIYAYRGSLTVEAGSSGTEIRDVEGSGLYAYDGALSATDLTINDVRGYGVYVYYANATITDTIISSALSGGVYAVRGDIDIHAEATGVHISDVDGVGIYANTGDIIASDLELEDVRSHGVYSAYGDTTLTDVSVDGSGGIGVYVLDGTMTVENVSVSKVESHGLYAIDGDMNVTDSEVSNVDGVGVYVNTGDLTIDGVSVDGAGSYGIYALGGTDGETAYGGTISGAVVSDTLSAGIVGSRADLDVSASSVSGAGAQGIYVVNANLTVSDSSVSDTESHGYYVADGALDLTDCEASNVRNTGVAVAVGTASIDGLTMTDVEGTGESAGDNGISVSDTWTGYDNTITNCSIADVAGTGISVERADISYSEIIDPGIYGVVVSGHDASTITYTDITNAGYRGVVGISYGENLLDITNSNITGTYDWAVVYAQSVDNNYIAGNNDETGADTTNEGTLDGNRDASTTQSTGVDAITNARSTAVSGTGPR